MFLTFNQQIRDKTKKWIFLFSFIEDYLRGVKNINVKFIMFVFSIARILDSFFVNNENEIKKDL